MDWLALIIGIVPSLCCAGGLIYMIFDKKIQSNKEKAETGQINQQNNMSAVEMYKELDTVVEEKVDKRLQIFANATNKRFDMMGKRVQQLEKMKCFRSDCPNRINDTDFETIYNEKGPGE